MPPLSKRQVTDLEEEIEEALRQSIAMTRREDHCGALFYFLAQTWHGQRGL